jgi:ankyrin repeat protein
MSAGNWKEMFQAACDGDVALVEYHVNMGVDVDYAHPEFQETALVASILARQVEVALFLLDHGANPHLLSEADGLTPMQAARQTGLNAVIDKLRALGA